MTINFNVAPYYDDYSDDDGYLRVLFRPGYSIQARELTQLQTILQKQVERFGNHIFKNGSMVIPGGVNVDNQVHFMKLENLSEGLTVASYISSFQNKIVTGVESGVKALCVDTSDCDCMVPGDSDIPTLYFKIEKTGGDGDVKKFIPGEQVIAFEEDNTVEKNYRLVEDQVGDFSATIRATADNGVLATTYTENPVTDVMGYAYAVEVDQGVYFVDGFFVQNEELHLYIGRFTKNVSYRVGFKVTEELITPEEQPLLSDNSQGTTNFAAPGAHRYRIKLDLVRLPIDSTDDMKFIELLRVVDGQVQSKLENSDYSELEKTLARRTFDQSGSYEVSKFKVTTREHLNLDGTGVYPPRPETGAISDQTYGDEDKLVAAIDPGKAYIEGFEVESTATRFVDIDKARENTLTGEENDHIVRETQFPIATPVGNYVIINKVFNRPLFESNPIINLYSTPRGNLVDGALPNIANKVGTARVRAFQLHSGDYDGDSTEFKLSIFDVKMDINPATNLPYSFEKKVKSLGTNLAYAQSEGLNTSALFTADIVSTDYSIVGSVSCTNGSTAVTGVGTLFVTEVQPGDILVITDGTSAGRNQIGVVDQVLSNISLTLVENATETLSDQAALFRASIKDSRNSGLLFKSQYNTIKTLRGQDSSGNDTLQESVQVVMLEIGVDTASESGVVSYSLPLGQTFLSSSDLSNFTLYYTDPQSGNNRFVNLESSDISVDAANNQVTITNLEAASSYTLIAAVKEVGVGASENTKTLESATKTITGRKNVTENTIVLDHADVLRINDIQVTPGDFNAFNINNAVSIKDKYVFDNGQRTTHYQAGRLSLKPNVTPPSGAIRITYEYFGALIGNRGYFSVDSYTNIIDNPSKDFTYADIPSIVVRDVNGESSEVYLHDVIDYRPTIEGENKNVPQIPKIGRNFETSLAYYLPRFDKIVLDNIGRFNVLKGVPALDPQEPSDPKSGLVLATVFVPAYTKSTQDVILFPRDNRRYTMKDIGNLEKRIQNLEYYVSLTLLEQETSSLSIKDGDTGLDRFKNGFIVDQFVGHGIGDVKNVDYRIAVDPDRQELRPMHFTDAIELVENLNTSEERDGRSYRRNGDIISLPYTDQLFLFNPYGTRTIDVNPYKVGAFKGEITLNPEGDNWKDTDRRPDLQVTDDNNVDAIRFMAESLGVTGTEWNEWQTRWTGSTTTTQNWQTGNPNRRRQWVTGYQRTTTVDTGVRSREGIRTSLQTSVNTQDYGDRVVDISFAPYMRARPVTFVAHNLKPESKFYAFFDGEAVSDYVVPSNIFTVRRTAGTTSMNFDTVTIGERVVASDSERSYRGRDEPAFQIGDVIRNEAHTPVVINSIQNITTENTRQFTINVVSADGLSPGHIVQLYNLGPQRIRSRVRNRRGNFYWQTTIRNRSLDTSAEINGRRFKILKIDGTTVTLAHPNGRVIAPFAAYNKSAYATNDGGRLRRYRASGVVVYGGNISESDTNGAVVQDIHVANIKYGFALGEDVEGKITFGGGVRNSVNIESINDLSISDQDALFADSNANLFDAVPVMKTAEDSIRTDVWGSCSGVFHLPNSDALRFRTGEREFKLTDNISNSDADFDSKGTQLYYSQGVTLSKERTIVNSRQANFVQDRLYEEIPTRRVSVSTRTLYRYYTGHDPVAQTFVVQSEGGAFITAIDMYFSEAGNRPITVELRTTNNNTPSSKILPFTMVTKSPNEINVSDDGTVATRFTFRAPVYLQDNEMYALVVKTDEPGAQVFVSEVGKTDIATENIVTVQPLTGSLYLSQNSKEFEINPLLDLKFRMYRAQFDINQVPEVDLKASIPKDMTLPENPFEITPGTDLIRVHAPRHGFSAGDIASIDNVPEFIDEDETEIRHYGTGSSTYGIPADLLNGEVEVLAEGLELDYFCFRVDSLDEYVDTQGNPDPNILLKGSAGTETTVQEILDQFVKGEYGGTGITCSRQLVLDYMFLKSESIVPTETTLTWKAQAISANGTPTGYVSLDENKNFTFGSRKIVRSYENEQEVNALLETAIPSLTMKAQLSSTNVNVSPLIDLQKIAAFSIRNLINNPSEELINIPEIDSRTLLQAGDVSSTEIDQVIGDGSLVSYFLDNVYGAVNTTAGTSGADVTITINSADRYWTGDGSNNQSIFERVFIGDRLHTTSATDMTATTSFGVVIDLRDDLGNSVESQATVLVVDTSTGDASYDDNEQFLITSRRIQGSASTFTTQTPPGTLIRNSQEETIGIVESVDSNTVIKLTAEALVDNGTVNGGATYYVETPEAKLYLTNSGGKGIIRTNIDTADNLLALAKAGKYIYITDITSGIDGKWLVEEVKILDDNTVSVGNEEQDKIEVVLSEQFVFPGTITSYTVDLVNSYIYFQGDGQIITDTTENATGTGDTKFLSQVQAGDRIVTVTTGGDAFDATTGSDLLGVVDAVTTNSVLTFVDPAPTNTSQNYWVRRDISSFKISQLDKFVEDWAPIGSSNYANYVSRALVLSNPAEALKIIFEANIPSSTSLSIFYKGWTGDADPDSINYIDTGFVGIGSDPVDSFTERTIDIDVEPFTNMQIKIIMKSSDGAKIPKMKNLRMIAHS